MYHTFQKEEYLIYISLILLLWILLIPPLKKYALPLIFTEFLGILAILDWYKKICVFLVIVIVIDTKN